ncbi:MAG: hypothetical protein EBR09_11025 [Proteobacteria bacterium]|nr:hypothetical protein [Pseudomonadota bacterium]
MTLKRFMCSAFAFAIGLSAAGESLAGPETAKIFKAEYTVPLSDDSLKPYATFVIDSYIVDTLPDGKATLSFLMPDDLAAGVERKLEFIETEKNALERVLSGDSGIVRCTVPWVNSVCRIEFFRNAIPKYSDVVEHVLEKYSVGDGLVGRLDVLRRFNTEPIGVVTVLELKK